MDLTQIDAILFDKDGTLFDFQGTWAAWAAKTIYAMAGGDLVLARDVADAISFDLEAGLFDPDSVAVAGAPDELVAVLKPILPDMSPEEILAHLNPDEGDVTPAQVPELKETLMELTARGIKLGVVTNDFESAARAQLFEAEIESFFDVVIGYDSGFGGKPAPDGCLAAAKALGAPPARAMMVGDSLHDLVAGKVAGMTTVGVLTGTALHDELAPFADVVLEHMGGLRAL